MIAIVAMGQQLVILTRASTFRSAPTWRWRPSSAGSSTSRSNSAPLVVLAMIVAGALVGAVNGLVYVFGRLPHPFIITLATLSICRGLALEFALGHTTMRGMPDAISPLGETSALGVPTPSSSCSAWRWCCSS